MAQILSTWQKFSWAEIKKIFRRSDLRSKIIMCQLCSLNLFPRKFVTAMHCAPILHTCQENDTKKEWTVRKTYLWFLLISTQKTGNYFFSQKGVKLRPLQQLIGHRLYRMIFAIKLRTEFTKPLCLCSCLHVNQLLSSQLNLTT